MDIAKITVAIRNQRFHVEQRHYDEIVHQAAMWSEDPNIRVQFHLKHGCWRCYATVKQLHAMGLHALDLRDASSQARNQD